MPATIYQRVKGDVRPLKGQILVYDMEKGQKLSRGGIIITDDNGRESGIKPRWCTVYRVGEGIDYVEEGQRILIEHGRWTYGIHVDLPNGEEIYLQKVEPESILLVEDNNDIE